MSFFNDFLLDLGLDDIENNVLCYCVFDKGLKITGNIKIEQMQETEIIIKCKKERIRILGQDMIVKSISKGELDVIGKIYGVTKI